MKMNVLIGCRNTYCPLKTTCKRYHVYVAHNQRNTPSRWSAVYEFDKFNNSCRAYVRLKNNEIV